MRIAFPTVELQTRKIADESESEHRVSPYIHSQYDNNILRVNPPTHPPKMYGEEGGRLSSRPVRRVGL